MGKYFNLGENIHDLTWFNKRYLGLTGEHYHFEKQICSQKKKQHFPKHEQSISDIQDEHLMEFSEQKFFISAVWCYGTIRVEKYNLFMTAHEKKTLTSHSFIEIELKTFITETVIAKSEFV